MKPDDQDDSRTPAERHLARFLEAHPDGDHEAFETWLKQQLELQNDAKLANSVRALFTQWQHAAELLGEGFSSRRSAQGSFFRRAKGADDQAAQPSAGQHGAGLQPGKRVGHFTLRSFIAQGGMGQVWQAHDENLRTDVALKLILPGRIDARSLDLFAREARAGGRLRHPYIVATLATGRADGLTWIAQELVDGSWTLKDYLDQLRTEDTVPKDHYKSVALFIARVADGLQAAHDAGVIHRDVKPANILIAPDDTPRLTDFGLARVVDDSFLSQSGDLAGTWSYMSPEQVTAKRMGLDHRTDIFSLGVVLYELLTLRRPFEGDTTHQIAAQIITHEPPQASKIRSQCPRELAIICGKALEKAPSRRYATMREFSADLHRHLANEPILARPTPRLVKALKWAQRHPSRAVAASAATIVVLTVIGFGGVISQQNLKLERAYDDLALAAAPQAIGLLEQESELWPAIPSVVPNMERWLGSKSALFSRKSDVMGRVSRLLSGETDLVGGELDSYSAFGLQKMQGRFDELELLEPLILERLEIAKGIETWSTNGAEVRKLWSTAIAAIAQSERYGELVLSPQLGLVPLQEDPTSQLWEFWHVQSGARPERDPETNQWVITGKTGMVMVLVPGGHAFLGTPELPETDPLFDWVVTAYDNQISNPLTHEVDLEPFFLSKYEMTQGQWMRAQRSNPSRGSMFGESHPVDSASWGDSLDTAKRLDLSLPTEAQWEWAARGGTRERFFTGQEPQSLKGYAILMPDMNLDGFADLGEDGQPLAAFGFPYAKRHEAVGSSRANPFGLHEVIGNVWEWSLDVYSPSAAPRPGDGLRVTEDSTRPKRVMRGGSFASAWTNARASMRKPWEQQNTDSDVGLRPARSIR